MKQKTKCKKCKKTVDSKDLVCCTCGSIAPTKVSMLKKQDLKKFKKVE